MKITLEDLYNASDIKDISRPIKLGDKATIDRFYSAPYPYYMNWAHNTMAIHWQVRFSVITINDDEILIAYKNVSFFAVKYYRLLFYPKSLKGIRKNEDVIYKELIKHVKEVVTQEPNGKPLDYDFYIIAKDKFAEINTSAYRSKHRINILKEDSDFVVRLAKTDDREAIETLINIWKKSKGNDYSGAVFKGFLKDYEKWLNTEGIRILVMSYKNIIMGVYVYINTTENNYYQIMNVALNRNIYKADGLMNKILSDTSQISLYFTLEMLHKDVDLITFAGGRIPSLVAYKKRVYKNCFKYYRYNTTFSL